MASSTSRKQTSNDATSTQAPAVRRRAPREGAFGRDEWLNAARKALIKGGIDQVKVERLSKQVKVARSSFYCSFSSRGDLLDALLDHWEATNTGPMLRAIDAAITEGPKGIFRLTQLWIDEREFSPAYDTAVRNWGSKDPKVAAVVRAVDDKRIAAMTRLMQVFGFEGDEALVRARVLYFHQVGYYSLNIRDRTEERLRLLPIYIKAITGFEA